MKSLKNKIFSGKRDNANGSGNFPEPFFWCISQCYFISRLNRDRPQTQTGTTLSLQIRAIYRAVQGILLCAFLWHERWRWQWVISDDKDQIKKHPTRDALNIEVFQFAIGESLYLSRKYVYSQPGCRYKKLNHFLKWSHPGFEMRWHVFRRSRLW